MQVKIQKAIIQSYRPGGEPIYSRKSLYAVFVDGILILDTEREDDKKIVDGLRAHPQFGRNFEEVSPTKKGEVENVKVPRLSLAALRGMNKKDLLILCDTYKAKGINSDTDTKEEIIKAITLFYEAH